LVGLRVEVRVRVRITTTGTFVRARHAPPLLKARPLTIETYFTGLIDQGIVGTHTFNKTSLHYTK
jgi:hypothetical protein